MAGADRALQSSRPEESERRVAVDSTDREVQATRDWQRNDQTLIPPALTISPRSLSPIASNSGRDRKVSRSESEAIASTLRKPDSTARSIQARASSARPARASAQAMLYAIPGSFVRSKACRPTSADSL